MRDRQEDTGLTQKDSIKTDVCKVGELFTNSDMVSDQRSDKTNAKSFK
jgi:hypothetical protein